jgi:hypothetical protein
MAAEDTFTTLLSDPKRRRKIAKTIKTGPWTEEEDDLVRELVRINGP